MSHLSFIQLTAGIIDTTSAMREQVVLCGCLEDALKKGCEPIIRRHLVQINTLCMGIDRILKVHVVDGTYAVVGEAHRSHAPGNHYKGR